MDQWAEVRATAPGDALSVLFAGIGAATSVGMGYGVSAQAPQLVRYPSPTSRPPALAMRSGL
ncbi:MAG TPA: hypothetical protein VGR61_11090 [Candidatus Dormibacteraeota bacterium]|nr:hypothetical protein [Candidatus Dormibacteraeota bacterium]